MAVLTPPRPKTELMNILWDIQRKRRFISHDDMTKICEEFHMSRMELEGVITFYHFFHRAHSGKYTIYLNTSLASQQRKFKKVKKAFEKECGTPFETVSNDKMFGLFFTSCIGLSDQETAALINFVPFTHLTPKKVRAIIDHLKRGESLDALFELPDTNIRYSPPKEKTVFLKDFTIGRSLEKLVKMSPEEVIELIKDSRLKGRGGAFFPTGIKWELCRNNSSDQKYIICNADEGEPGTFKDRVLLQRYASLLIEGMTVAGYAVGADKGIIYLRAEYFYLRDLVQKAIDEAKQKAFLGKDIMGIEGFNFDMTIHMGAGAYICGEETALIHSMEGKRGEPSTKEYFPVEKGFLGKPTIVNNVETLCAIPRILEMGLEKYLAIGTPMTPGTKLLSVSGDCNKPGVYEIEWGMKLRDFLELIEAEDPHMVLFNGYAGEMLSHIDFDREISGENLLAEHIQFNLNDPIEYARKMSAVGLRSGGSFMVFNEKRNLLEILKNINNFFVKESCGVCVPCRTGNFLLTKKIHKIELCHAENNDLDDIKEWSTIIKQSSRCGLGKTSTNVLLTAMLKFPEEFRKCLLAESDYNQAFDLDKATNEYERIINEIENNYG